MCRVIPGPVVPFLLTCIVKLFWSLSSSFRVCRTALSRVPSRFTFLGWMDAPSRVPNPPSRNSTFSGFVARAGMRKTFPTGIQPKGRRQEGGPLKRAPGYQTTNIWIAVIAHRVINPICRVLVLFLHPPSTRLKLTIRSSVQHILSASCKWYIFIWETVFFTFLSLALTLCLNKERGRFFVCFYSFFLSIFLNLDHSVPYTYAIKLHTPRYFCCINPCQQVRFRCSARKHVL